MGNKPDKKEPAKATKTGQGSAVVLPNGERRIDFIRDMYYTKGKHTDKDPKRGAIKTAINEMLPEAEAIPYQIVFAATKTDVDPRTVAKEEPAKKEPAKSKQNIQVRSFYDLAKELEAQKGRDSREGVPILCFDPGHTTGWSKWFGYELTEAGELDTSDMDLATKNLGNMIIEYKPHMIVIEDYRVYKWRAKHHVGSEMLTTRVIGCIETFASLDSIPLVKQPAHIAKTFCTDKKLKAWGFYSKGGKHARDSIRHGCYFILNGKVTGTRKKGNVTVG